MRTGLRARRGAAATDSRARPRPAAIKSHPSVDLPRPPTTRPKAPQATTAASAALTAIVISPWLALAERRPAEHHRRARRIAIADRAAAPRPAGRSQRRSRRPCEIRNWPCRISASGPQLGGVHRGRGSRSSSANASEARPAWARSRARSSRSEQCLIRRRARSRPPAATPRPPRKDAPRAPGRYAPTPASADETVARPGRSPAAARCQAARSGSSASHQAPRRALR